MILMWFPYLCQHLACVQRENFSLEFCVKVDVNTRTYWRVVYILCCKCPCMKYNYVSHTSAIQITFVSTYRLSACDGRRKRKSLAGDWACDRRWLSDFRSLRRVRSILAPLKSNRNVEGRGIVGIESSWDFTGSKSASCIVENNNASIRGITSQLLRSC